MGRLFFLLCLIHIPKQCHPRLLSGIWTQNGHETMRFRARFTFFRHFGHRKGHFPARNISERAALPFLTVSALLFRRAVTLCTRFMSQSSRIFPITPIASHHCVIKPAKNDTAIPPSINGGKSPTFTPESLTFTHSGAVTRTLFRHYRENMVTCAAIH